MSGRKTNHIFGLLIKSNCLIKEILIVLSNLQSFHSLFDMLRRRKYEGVKRYEKCKEIMIKMSYKKHSVMCILETSTQSISALLLSTENNPADCSAPGWQTFKKPNNLY